MIVLMLFLYHIHMHRKALRVSEEHAVGVEWVYTWSRFGLIPSLRFTLTVMRAFPFSLWKRMLDGSNLWKEDWFRLTVWRTRIITVGQHGSRQKSVAVKTEGTCSISAEQEAGSWVGSCCWAMAWKPCFSLVHFLDITSRYHLLRISPSRQSHPLGTNCLTGDAWAISHILTITKVYVWWSRSASALVFWLQNSLRSLTPSLLIYD